MRKSLVLLAAGVLLAGLAGVPAGAHPAAAPAPGRWTTSGPRGADIHDIAVDPSHPNTVWAAAGRGGVYRSTDGGLTWTPRNAGLDGRIANAIAVAPSNPDVVYVAMCTTGCKMFRTVDAGKHWAIRSNGASTLSFGTNIDSIAIGPHDPNTAYIAISYGGVFKTTDGGAHWLERDTGITSKYDLDILIRPLSPHVLYVGTSDGVFRSSNSAGSWSPRTTGITGGEISAIAIDRTRPSTLYASTYGGGAWVSSNDGGNWVSLDGAGLPSNTVDDLVAAPGGHMVYVVDRSEGVWAINGVRGGATWTQMSSGLPLLRDVWNLAVRPTSPGTLYVGTSGLGSFRSTDHAAHWSRENTGLKGSFIRSLALRPNDATRIYAGGITDEGMFTSTNSGASWASHSSGLTEPNVWTLAVSKSSPSVLYAGTYNGASGNGVYTSSDSGATWVQHGLAGIPIFAVAVDPTDPQHAWAGEQGSWVTTNGGGNWNPDNTGFPTSLPYVESYAIDPTNPQVLYAGAYRALYKSTDGGGSWNEMDTGLTSTGTVESMQVLKQAPSTVFAGVYGFGVYRSTNGGATWSPRINGLTNKKVLCIALDPAHRGTLYAGTEQGVFRSTNGGGSWSAFALGMGAQYVNAIVVTPRGHTVVAATSGDGVFVRHV